MKIPTVTIKKSFLLSFLLLLMLLTNGAKVEAALANCSFSGNVGYWGACHANNINVNITSGHTTSVSNVTSGYTGYVTYLCTNGAWSVDSSDCTQLVANTNCAGTWSAYSACSASCDGGTQSKTFTVTTAQSGTGTACPASPVSQTCNTQACYVAPVCTQEQGTPVSCNQDLTQYGVPTNYTVGTATYTYDSCTYAVTYTGGCSAPATAPTVTLDDFSPDHITIGQSSSISFSSTNATSCSGSGYFWNGDLGGTYTPSPKSTGIMNTPGAYSQSVTCTGPGGSATSPVRSLGVAQFPTCSSTGPGGNPSIPHIQGTYDVYAYGVRDANLPPDQTVVFKTWSANNGQDDLVSYPSTNLGGGTFKGTINLANHADDGQYNVDVYMNNAAYSNLCGTVNFFRTGTPTGSINSNSCTIPVGSTSCNANVTWSTSNIPSADTVSIRRANNTTLYTGSNGTVSTVFSPQGTYCFDLDTGAPYGGVVTNLDNGCFTASCAFGSTWNSNSCVASNQTYTCAAKPATGTVFNTVSSYTQTWNGSAWTPANDATTEYNATADTSSCRYTCATNYSWNGSSCVAPLSVTATASSITLPTTSFTESYSLTNGTSANTTCRLLDYNSTALTAYSPCTNSITYTAPTLPGSYGYSVQAYKASTGETKTSALILTVNPAPPCTSQTISSCSLTGISSGDSSTGSCGSGYSGSCTYSCSNSMWSKTTNSCVRVSSFTATASTIVKGNSTKLTWATDPATACTGTGFSTGNASSNSTGVTVSPATTSTYQINCGAAMAQTTVTVLVPTVDSFSVTPTRVPPGGTVTVRWGTTNVTGCSVTKNGVSTPWSGTNTSKTDTVNTKTTYAITCDSLAPQSATVNVAPGFNEF